MAGASPLLTNRIFGVLANAVKIAVAAWGAVWIEPKVQEILPNAGEPIHYLLAAVLAASTLELLLQVILGWPRIRIAWAVKGEDAPISEVVARVRKSTANSQVFSIKVSTPPGGWLGYQLFRGYMRLGVKLQIRIERAPIIPTCEGTSKFNGLPTVAADDALNGFSLELGRAPRRPGPWHWADVRWRDEGTPTGDEFNIYYVFHHQNPFVKFLLNLLIWRSKNAHRFRVVGP